MEVDQPTLSQRLCRTRLHSPMTDRHQTTFGRNRHGFCGTPTPRTAKNEEHFQTEPYAAPTTPKDTQDSARKPTLSKYDNWDLVRSHHVPSLHARHEDEDGDDDDGLGDASTLTKSVFDPSEDSRSDKSSSSDWGVPTRNQNHDDSSWVNPARPLDPARKATVSNNVERMLVRQLEETRLRTAAKETSFEAAASKQDPETSHFRTGDAHKEPVESASAVPLAVAMTTKPGTLDLDERGWSMPSKATAAQSTHPNNTDIASESTSWFIPSRATTHCNDLWS